MILLEKQKQVDKIRDYIMEHRQIYDKLVIFGEATYEELPKELEEDVFLDVAVRTVREEDATNDDIIFGLACVIDDITDGKFHLIIMNDPSEVTSNILHEIENGEVIYEAGKDDSGITGNGSCILMRSENMRIVSIILPYFVFAAAVFSMVGLVNKGMEWKFYNTDAVLIRNVLFTLSTLVNLYVDRKTKWIYVNIISIILITVALVMKLFGISYPIWFPVFWCFYIWFVSGIQVGFNEKKV